MLETAFFVISKIVGLLLLVEIWLLIGMILSSLALWYGANACAAKVLAATIFLCLVVLSPLTDILLYQLERVHPANPDLAGSSPPYGIIVLGGSTIPRHTITWQQIELNDAAERITIAARLARQYPQARILLTGGSGSPADMLLGEDIKSEAAMMKALLLDLGVKADRLVLEEKSRNTAENALLSARIVGKDKTKHWLLVTSAFHMPRSVRSFEKAGWTDMTPYPVDHRTDPSRFASDWYPGGKFSRFNLLSKELVGLVVYALTAR